MRCGKCKAESSTIAHVRECYGVERGHGRYLISDGEMSGRPASEPSFLAPQNPASEPQITYVLGLQNERETGPDWTAYTADRLRSMERVDVSTVIQTLKGFPVKNRAERVSGNWTMPAGRYALNNNGIWIFYQVDRPTEGRWKGYTFVKRLIGAPGAYQKQSVPQPARDNVLSTIERDPKQAMVDYGLNSGVCGRCSSPLTDNESLARGLGPICAGKSGWF